LTGITRSPDGTIDEVSPYLFYVFNPAVMMITLVTYICSICALVCCGLHRSFPINYVLLAAFTFSVSYIVAFTTLFYQPIIVVEAACLTAAMVTAIAVYAATTK
jgi:FtsH-binding integral membrane protein